MLNADDLLAVLAREIPVRLINISGSGCLIAATSRLLEGTTGSLRMRINGVDYVDDVRVVRCSPVEGSSEYNLGLEFLWTTAPGQRSMRRVTAALQSAGASAGHRIEFDFARRRLAEPGTVGRHSRS